MISENDYNHDDECDNDNENNDDNDQTCSICPKERFHYNDDEDDNDDFENYQTCSIRVSICPKERWLSTTGGFVGFTGFRTYIYSIMMGIRDRGVKEGILILWICNNNTDMNSSEAEK